MYRNVSLERSPVVRGARMRRAAGPQSGNRRGPTHLLRRDWVALDEACYEVILRLDERSDLRADPELGRHPRGAVLNRAVDAE